MFRFRVVCVVFVVWTSWNDREKCMRILSNSVGVSMILAISSAILDRCFIAIVKFLLVTLVHFIPPSFYHTLFLSCNELSKSFSECAKIGRMGIECNVEFGEFSNRISISVLLNDDLHVFQLIPCYNAMLGIWWHVKMRTSLLFLHIAVNLRCPLVVKSFSLIIRLKVSFAELDGITLSCCTWFSSLLLSDCWAFLNLIQSLKSTRTIWFIFVWHFVYHWSSMWIVSLWCTTFLLLIGKVVKIVRFKH
jgi:hypothetical protein